MNKKKQPQKIKNNTTLFIQVFQMGIIQVEKEFNLESFFYKKIKFGCSRFCDLYLPYERHACELDIFKVGKGKAEIFLDPRLDGYINTSQKFGEVREFTSPRDALGVLTSIDDPLAIDLKSGARGRIRFLGFEIVFKVEVPQKEKVFKNLPKIEGGLFQLPSYDAPIEKHILPLSIFAMACLFIPIIYWLLSFPSKPLTGLLSIPPEITATFIAPENMRLLPHIFGTEYVPEKTPELALLWLHELQMRWENAEQGIEYHSVLPIISKSKQKLEANTAIQDFQKEIMGQYENIENEKKTLGTQERYFNYLKKSPIFASILSGKEGQSNYFTIEKRFHQLKEVDKALVEYLKLDHKIVKAHYENSYRAKKTGIVSPPQTGQVLGPQPDRIFNVELDNYKDAEYFARVSENSNYRKMRSEFIIQEAENEKTRDFTYSEPVFISSEGLIFPYQLIDEKNNLNREEDYNTFLSNALFSDAFILPPLPKPKSTIDLKMVEFVVYNKKEEIRSCYNSALRRNSHLNGDIKLTWLINESGKAFDVKSVNSSIQDKNLFRCIESRIKKWKFPKAKNGNFTVRFPFKFVYLEKDE